MAVGGKFSGDRYGELTHVNGASAVVSVVCGGCHGAIRVPVDDMVNAPDVTCQGCGHMQAVQVSLPTGAGPRSALRFSEFPSAD